MSILENENKLKDKIGECVMRFRSDDNYMYYQCMNDIVKLIDERIDDIHSKKGGFLDKYNALKEMLK